jgi:hypothetical protein
MPLCQSFIFCVERKRRSGGAVFIIADPSDGEILETLEQGK